MSAKSKLTILGTGTFFTDKDRSASAYLLETSNKKILIDCGPGTLIQLSKVGVKPEDIDYVFITHFHADHTADLFPFFMNIRLRDFFSKGKIKKIPTVIGPVGIWKFMMRLSEIFQLPAFQGWNKMKFINTKPSQKIGSIRVDSFKVRHIAFGLVANAYAYRFIINKKIITFSGDCVKCSGIQKACIDADIFVCDTSCAKGFGSPAHMDTYDIAEICSKSRVKKVVLTHFYPQTDKIDLVREVKEKFSGKIIRGKDLMVVSI